MLYALFNVGKSFRRNSIKLVRRTHSPSRNIPFLSLYFRTSSFSPCFFFFSLIISFISFLFSFFQFISFVHLFFQSPDRFEQRETMRKFDSRWFVTSNAGMASRERRRGATLDLRGLQAAYCFRLPPSPPA